MKVCIAQNVSLSDHLALSTYLRSISKYLTKQKDIELILLPLRGSKVPEDLPNNIDVCEINASLYSIKGNFRYAIGLYNKLKELNKKEDIDLIHCLYPNSSVLGAALFKRKSQKTKIVYDIRSPWIEMSLERGSIPRYLAPIYHKVSYFSESFLDKYVDGYIFITEGLKRFYENKIKLDSKPSNIIHSGIDLNLFSRKNPSIIRDRYNLKDDDFLLGYVGVISRMRELDFILGAFQKLTKINETYKLMLVGDGDDKKHLETLAKKLQIQNKVIFTGKVPYEQVSYYVSAFDVGLCHLPDKLIFRYSFPMKILEYLACETPVLASDIEAHREIARKLDKNIILYNFIDISDFIDKVLKIAKQYYPKENNWSLVSEFSWRDISNKLKFFYKGILR